MSIIPDDFYEDDLQEELAQDAEDRELGIRGWDFVDDDEILDDLYDDEEDDE